MDIAACVIAAAAESEEKTIVDNVETGSGTATPKFFAVDFFCGAGGTTRGLIEAGGYVLAGIDKVPDCAATYEANNVNRTLDGMPARYLQRDVFDKTDDYPDGDMRDLIVELNDLIQPRLDSHRNIPLLFSICAPCQPFTRLTQIQMTEKRETGRTRDRGLLGQSLEYIKTFYPEMIICENVAGIQKAMYGGVWQQFAAELEELGYIVGSAIVNASKFGIPQNRRRSIMLAVHRRAALDDAFGEWDATSIAVPMEDPEAPAMTVRDAIGSLPPIEAGTKHPDIPNHQSAKLSEINRRRLEAVQPGGSNLAFIGTDLELACHRKMREKEASGEVPNYTAGFSDVYCRMDPDKPSPAITTKFFATSCGRFGHYEQTRAISIREAAALQSFPNDYKFLGGSIQQNAKMVGNAVPPKLSTFFAGWLIQRAQAYELNEDRNLKREREKEDMERAAA